MRHPVGGLDSKVIVALIVALMGETACFLLFHSTRYAALVFAVMAVVTLVLTVVAIFQLVHLRGFYHRLFDSINRNLEASSNAFATFILPVAITSDQGEIIWYNDAFRRALLGGENVYGQDVDTLFNEAQRRALSETRQTTLALEDKQFLVYKNTVMSDDISQYVYFFVDETRLVHISKEYAASRPVVVLAAIDNLSELTKNLKDSERAAVSSAVETLLERWAGEVNGVSLKLSSSRFLVLMEERNLEQAMQNKFQLLDQVRNLNLGEKVKGHATLSIGVGHQNTTLSDCEATAYQALDMAQGRGGDQAAVKDPSGSYHFFGGVSKAVEKHTKVKARIVASAIKELIDASDRVIIMGHRYADLDAFGASLALWSLCRQLGKEVYIAADRQHTMAGDLIDTAEAYYGQKVVYAGAELLPLVDKKTLLIAVDTHRVEILDSPELYLAAKTVVVIDHHRKSVDYIENAVIFYHETAASSASELVTEILEYLGEQYVGQMEAVALLAGIMLDTKNFVLHTGVRTFEACAFLRERDADPVAAKRLFAYNIDAYQQKSQVVADAEVVGDCAISLNHCQDAQSRLASAQAADELLNMAGINGSFVLFREEDTAVISARSFGAINVQLIMESLGGGGHQTMAAAQLPGKSLEDAKAVLQAAIAEYRESQSANL